MRKIYIEKYKSIHNEICIDLESNNTVALIGQNGIGKTNILLAIEWFFSNKNNNNVRTIKRGTSVTDPVKMVFVENISNDQITNVKSLLKNNVNKWKLDLSKIEFDNYYNVVFKSDVLITKKYHDDFVSQENQKFHSIYLYLANLYISQGIELLKAVGDNDDFDRYFSKSENNIYYGINEQFYNECKTKYRTGSKAPISMMKFAIIENCKIDLDNLKNVFVIENKYISYYVKNADLENKTKVAYSLTELSQSNPEGDAKDIVNFLSNYFNFKNDIGTLSNYQQQEVKGSKNSVLVSDLINNLNDNVKKAVNKLFKGFDIYAIPNFRFANNELVLTVEDKNHIEVIERETMFNSSGYKAFFQFILKLKAIEYECKNSNKIFLLLADEPDKNLHILLQMQLLNFFIKTTKEFNNIKVIYTTHSPYLIDPTKSTIYVIDKYLKTKNDKLSGSTYIAEYIEDLGKMDTIRAISLLPIFEACNILYDGNNNNNNNTLSTFFNDLLKNSKILYIDEDLNKDTKKIDNFLEVAKNSGFVVKTFSKKEEINKIKFSDIIHVFESDIIGNNYNFFNELLSKAENQEIKIIIVKNNEL